MLMYFLGLSYFVLFLYVQSELPSKFSAFIIYYMWEISCHALHLHLINVNIIKEYLHIIQHTYFLGR